MLVGADAALRGRVAEALRRTGMALPVSEAENDLMALGAIGAGAAPVLVIWRTDGLAGAELEAAAAGFHAVAPEARLIAVASAAEHGRTPGRPCRGFACVLDEPVSVEDLAAALCPETRARGAGPAAPAGDSALADAAVRLALEQDSAAPAPEPPVSELGDMDLVEQLLMDRRGLGALALRMAGEHGGLAGLALAAEPAQVPAGNAWAPVEFRGRGLGLLHAPPPATAEALQPWAAWLARWLALGRQMDRLWDLALRDELTGAWNRRYFLRFLRAILERAGRERFRVTLMVFDIDDFKTYNDRFGHAAGDDILRETAQLMRSVVRGQDVVARIGGDEFAVIFWDAQGPRKPNSQHPVDVRQAAERFRRAICAHKFPKLLCGVPVSLTISGGLAGFPWDGRSPEELLERADAMALRSKQQGKNALVFGLGADQPDGAAPGA
jgi:diguanylate cyclase (GGDEF)-like protein